MLCEGVFVCECMCVCSRSRAETHTMNPEPRFSKFIFCFFEQKRFYWRVYFNICLLQMVAV